MFSIANAEQSACHAALTVLLERDPAIGMRQDEDGLGNGFEADRRGTEREFQKQMSGLARDHKGLVALRPGNVPPRAGVESRGGQGDNLGQLQILGRRGRALG